MKLQWMPTMVASLCAVFFGLVSIVSVIATVISYTILGLVLLLWAWGVPEAQVIPVAVQWSAILVFSSQTQRAMKTVLNDLTNRLHS